jgi:hypothetical protein
LGKWKRCQVILASIHPNAWEGRMQRSDIRAVGDLAGEASSVLTTLVRGMHAGIAGRVFDSIGTVLAAVNGIYGDELTAHENPLAGAMVDADPDELLRDRRREAPFLPHATFTTCRPR